MSEQEIEALVGLVGSVRKAHRHIRVPGGYVACTCEGEWDDHYRHVDEEIVRALLRRLRGAGCSWCPAGCNQCTEDRQCECYRHQDEPDRHLPPADADEVNNFKSFLAAAGPTPTSPGHDAARFSAAYRDHYPDDFQRSTTKGAGA